MVESGTVPKTVTIYVLLLGNQQIYFSDTTFVSISIKADKSAAEIIEMARNAAISSKYYHSARGPLYSAVPNSIATGDECLLIEVKSNGERVVFASSEVSIPTMLSLNGKLVSWDVIPFQPLIC